MEFRFYNIKQVSVDTNGIVKENIIKRTMSRDEANKFFEIAKELRPQDKFYMYENVED